MVARRGVARVATRLAAHTGAVGRAGSTATEATFIRGFAATSTASTSSSAAGPVRAAGRGLWAAAGFAAAGATVATAAYEPRSAVCKAKPAPLPSPPPGAPKEVILYQYEVCPFCCKVKAFLDYHNIPYRVVEVDPVFKGEIKWSDHKKVPQAMIDNVAHKDSTAIIAALQGMLDAAKPPAKKGWLGRKAQEEKAAAAKEEETKWQTWIDDKFVKVLTANIYRSWEESWQTFDYITTHGKFGTVQREFARAFGACLMYVVGGRMPKKYNIEGDLREALYNSANEFVSALDGQQFMGGAAPNNADLALFGVIRAVTGTDAYWDLLKGSNILPWFQRMSDVVGDSTRIEEHVAAES